MALELYQKPEKHSEEIHQYGTFESVSATVLLDLAQHQASSLAFLLPKLNELPKSCQVHNNTTTIDSINTFCLLV